MHLLSSGLVWFGLIWFCPFRRSLESFRTWCWCVARAPRGHCGIRPPSPPSFPLGDSISLRKALRPISGSQSSAQDFKTGETLPIAGGAAGCPSGAASNQLSSHLEWRQPQGKQSQGMENEQVLKHFGEPRPPNQKPAPPRDFPGSGPSQVLFFFSGRSPKEHAGTRCWAPTCEVTSLPARASVLWAATQAALMPSVPCALTPAPSTGPTSKRHWWKYQETKPSQQHMLGLHTHFICQNPLVPLSKTSTYICTFCSIMLLV